MRQQIHAIQAEFIKLKHSNILWVTFIAFGLAPIMGGVFILILQDPEILAKAGGLAAKAQAMNFEGTWKSYIGLLSQAVGVGGVLVFGFVVSWIFGREYLVFAQIIAATGYGSYYPWSVPGLYSGSARDYKDLLNTFSYFILVLTGVTGYIATIVYWKWADQAK